MMGLFFGGFKVMNLERVNKTMEMPIDELVKLIEFTDGIAEFSMVAFYDPVGIFSCDLFGVIQARSGELNKAGYKTFSVENKGWYQMNRTWYVWSKEKTIERDHGKNEAIIVLVVSIFIFIAYMVVGFLK